MTTQNRRPPYRAFDGKWAAAGFALSLTVATVVAGPPAGSRIGNQATATFTDPANPNQTRTATSNTVETIVQQVASFALDQTQSLSAAPGSQVVFPHTLTNTGNGDDSFTLSFTGNAGDFALSDPQFFADANCDGLADNTTPITALGPVAPDAPVCFVAVATVPNTAAATQSDSFGVTATSQFDNAAVQTNTDTVTVSADAVIRSSKAISAPSGGPGSGPHTVTLTVTNVGAATATDVALFDDLNELQDAANGGGFTFVAGSGRSSLTGATALTDTQADSATETPVDFRAGLGGGLSANQVYARIASIAPNQTVTVTFQLNIAGDARGTLQNAAQFCYDANGATADGNTPTACDPNIPGSVDNTGLTTNIVPFDVLLQASVDADDQGPGGTPRSSTDDGAVGDDIVQEDTVTQGAVVRFDNIVTNTGSDTDSFDIELLPTNGTFGGSDFPAGTAFRITNAAGVALQDSNGNGIPDTGPLAPGQSLSVFVEADLPDGVSGASVNWTTVKRATSVTDPGVFDDVADRVVSVTANTVDLQNGPTAAPTGVGPGNLTTVITTNSVASGASTTFQLIVDNDSAVADTFNLAVTNTLPSGWTVRFLADGGAGDCSTTGAVLPNTGVLQADDGDATPGGPDQRLVCAVVSVPAGSPAVPTPGQNIDFQVVSPTTGTLDVKRDAVVVGALRDLSIVPNNADQVFPNGSVVYSHTLTNEGNVLEGGATGEVLLRLTSTDPNFTAVLFFDANDNGVLDPTDPIVDDLNDLVVGGNNGLDPGEQARIFVRVTAPSSAQPGDVNVTTVSVDSAAGAPDISATDTTTVVDGQVRLIKEQALDANCDGTPEGAFTQAQITTGAIPGACLRYRVIATNQGVVPNDCVVITDSTPNFTAIESSTAPAASFTGGAGVTASGAITVSAPADGATGLVQTNAAPPTGITCPVGNDGFSLAPGATGTLEFTVRIDPLTP